MTATCVSRCCDLDSDMMVTSFDILIYSVFNFFRTFTIRMTINRCRASRFSSPQITYWHVCHFPLNVPESLIDPAQCIIRNWPIASIRGYVRRLPNIFNVLNIFMNKKWSQIIVDCSENSIRPLSECCTSNAVQTRLRCSKFHNY